MIGWISILLLILETIVLTLSHPHHFNNWYYIFGSCCLILGASILIVISMKYSSLLNYLSFGIVFNFVFDWGVLYFTEITN
jgi:hypothetical protein